MRANALLIDFKRVQGLFPVFVCSGLQMGSCNSKVVLAVWNDDDGAFYLDMEVMSEQLYLGWANSRNV